MWTPFCTWGEVRRWVWGHIHSERRWSKGLTWAPHLLLWSLSGSKELLLSLFQPLPRCLVQKSSWHLKLIPGLRLPSGHHRAFMCEWENPSNRDSLRSCLSHIYFGLWVRLHIIVAVYFYLLLYQKWQHTADGPVPEGRGAPLVIWSCTFEFRVSHTSSYLVFNIKVATKTGKLYPYLIERGQRLREVKDILQSKIMTAESRLSSRFQILNSVLTSLHIRNLH